MVFFIHNSKKELIISHRSLAVKRYRRRKKIDLELNLNFINYNTASKMIYFLYIYTTFKKFFFILLLLLNSNWCIKCFKRKKHCIVFVWVIFFFKV